MIFKTRVMIFKTREYSRVLAGLLQGGCPPGGVPECADEFAENILGFEEVDEDEEK